MKQEEIKKLHNGVHRCPLLLIGKYMPEVVPILESAPIKHLNYVVDVKVHMLMPEQYPCIPGWHFDNVPRDKNGKQLMDNRNSKEKMYIWVSNDPLPTFSNGLIVKEKEWIEFTQYDEHKGNKSKHHKWRLFIRLSPTAILEPNKESEILRRHSQVYLSENFKW